MALRNIHDDIITALQNREPLLTYHLVKFEKPSGNEKANKASRIDYVYLTDAPYDVDFDSLNDGTTNVDTYRAGGVVKIGKVQEAIEAKATKMSLVLSAVKLGASAIASITTTSITAVAPGTATLTLNIDLFGAGFYVGDTLLITETDGGGSYTVRINRIRTNGTVLEVTNLGSNQIPVLSAEECTIDYINPEVSTLTSRQYGSLSFESYVNRNVEIYRVFAHPKTGVRIGSPFLYFKGIIAQGTLKDTPTGNPTVTWSLTSHWGDFVRVQGRLTSDEFHRGLNAAGAPEVGAALKTAYTGDFGFQHADKSLNVIAKYTGTDSRMVSRRRGGIAGAFGGRKYSTEYYEVERELDLRLNLESKFIPVVYGVQKIDSFPAFADIIITDDPTPGQTGSSANAAQSGGVGFTTMYSANVLCEGPISALFDVYVKNQALVCRDTADEATRGTATARSSQIKCIGLMEKGDVASGGDFNRRSNPAGRYLVTREDGRRQYVGGNFPGPFGGTIPDFTNIPAGSATISEQNTGYTDGIGDGSGDQKGILHEKTIGPLFNAENLNLTFHAGKPDQLANTTLMNKASGVGGGGFVAQKYYEEQGIDTTTYWGESHRLLDTAYTVIKDKISDSDAQLPEISYVVKGKFVNCFNYDGSYRNTLVGDTASNQYHGNFLLGDKVTVSPYAGSGTAVTYPFQIIDKWFILDLNSEFDHRIRLRPVNPEFQMADVDNASHLVSESNHGFSSESKVKLVNVSGNVPTGLTANTEYFLVKVNNNQYYFSDTAANAAIAAAALAAGNPAPTSSYIQITQNGTGVNRLEYSHVSDAITNSTIGRFTTTSISNSSHSFISSSEDFTANATDPTGTSPTIPVFTSSGYIHNVSSLASNFTVGGGNAAGIQITREKSTNVDLTAAANNPSGNPFGRNTISAIMDEFDLNPRQFVDLYGGSVPSNVTNPTVADISSTVVNGLSVPSGSGTTYTIDFANCSSLLKNLLKVIKEAPEAAKDIDFEIKRDFSGNASFEDQIVRPFHGAGTAWASLIEKYDPSTEKVIIQGTNSDIERLFQDFTDPTDGNSSTVVLGQGTNLQPSGTGVLEAKFKFFQIIVQDSSDSTPIQDLDLGTTLTLTKDTFEDKIVGLSYPPSDSTLMSASGVVRTNNLLVLTETLIGSDHGVAPMKYFYGVNHYEGSSIPSSSDRRVTINPAMQLLDYLTSKTYGKGLTPDLINFDSFKEAARACDESSDVTILVENSSSNPAPTVTVGETYEYRPGSHLFFEGTVSKVEDIEFPTVGLPNSTTPVSYSQITFTDVIGKLGRKWYSYTQYRNGEIVWTNNGFIREMQGAPIGGAATIAEPNEGTSNTFRQTANRPFLRRTTGTLNNLYFDTVIHFGSTGNPIVKKVTHNEVVGGKLQGINLISGYSMYDACEVKYWKYLGWEDRTQRFATRHQMNQTIDTSAPLFDNVNQMLTQFNGILRYSNGRYELDIKTKAPPTFAPLEKINEDRIVGDIKIDDKGVTKTFNSITTAYVDPQNSFNSKNITFYNSTYKKQDRGISRQGQYKAPGITNYFNNRMNIKQMLDESRTGITASFTGSPETYVLLPGNLLTITYPRFNWEDKIFRIESMSPREDLLVDFVVKEHNDNAYILEHLVSDIVTGIYPEGPGFPQVISSPPTALSASQNKFGGVELNWENSNNFRKETHIVEIWRSTNSSWTASFGNDPDSPTGNPIDLSRSNTHLDVDFEDGDNTYYYWIRYFLPNNTGDINKKEKFSNFHPLTTEPGVEGKALDNTGKSVRLDGPQIAQYDSPGDRISAATFTYTALASNFLAPQFKFTLDGVAGVFFAPLGGATSATASFSVPATFFTGFKDIKVEVREGGSGPVLAEATLSLGAIKASQAQKTVKLFNKQNNVTSTTFTVSDPADQTYTNPTNNIPSGWSTTRPSLTTNLDVIFVVERLFTDDGLSPQQANWTTPVIDSIRNDGQPGNPGPSGDAAIVMNLNNENHTIPANSGGAALSYANAATTATIFQGNSDITNTYTFSSVATSGITFSTFNGGRTINVTNMTNTTTDGTVTITATRTNFPTLQAVFGVSKVNAGADGTPATVFQLILSPGTIRKLADGSFSPSQVSINARKTVGTTNSAVTSSDGVTIRAFRDSSTSQFTSSNTGSLTVASSAYGSTSSQLRFELTSSSNSTIIHDSETVPIIADGSEGDAGLRSIQGFLYYKKTGSQRNIAPSGPSGATYTFSSGQVSGSGISTSTSNLSNIWQNQPQILDPSQLETIWVLRYYGTESTANSSTISVSYSTVVQYTNFTGVVTFSGGTLSSQTGGSVTPIEASDLGASGTTVIDGGRIDTDSLFAQSIAGDITETFSMGMDGSIGFGGRQFTSQYSTLIDIPPPADIGTTRNTEKSLFGVATLTIVHNSTGPIELYGYIETVSGMDYEFTLPNLNQRTVSDATNLYPIGTGGDRFFQSSTGRRVAVFSDNLLDNICHGGEIFYTSTQQARVDGVTFQRSTGNQTVLQTRLTYTNGSGYSNNNWSYIPNGSKWRLIPTTVQGLDQNRIGGRVYVGGEDYVSLSLPWKLPKILHTTQTRLRFRVVNLTPTTTLRITTANVQAGFAR